MEERRPGFAAERGMTLPPLVDNAAVRWGSAFEDAIVELAEAKRGYQVVEREAFWSVNGFGDEPFFERRHGPELANYISCHIDGMYLDQRENNTLHEGKTTSLFAYWDNWGTPGTDRIPQGYQVQVQHQMLCTGAAEAIVSVLVFPRRVDEWEKEGLEPGTARIGQGGIWKLNEQKQYKEIGRIDEWANVFAQAGLFHQYPVSASPTLQRQLVDAYRHFWHTYVLPEREPEIDAYADIRRAFPAPKGTLVATETEERWTAEYRQIGEEIGASGRLAKRREELKVLLLKSMRARDGVMDSESREKTVLMNATGHRIASWDGKTFR